MVKITGKRSFEGKSIGRSNETTPHEQAWAQANKRWIKQLDKEYFPDENDEEGQKMLKKVLKEKKKSGGHNINTVAASSGARAKKNVKRDTKNTLIDTDYSTMIIPMKAHDWEISKPGDLSSVLGKVSKFFENEDFFYAQPKLDGWRAIINISFSGKIVITSNSGKQYPWFVSLRKLLKEWFLIIKKEDLLGCMVDGLDGEMYSKSFINSDGVENDTISTFSIISSICGLTRSNPHELEDQIKYNCFDIVDSSGKYTQEERFEFREQLFRVLPKSCKKRIIKVETRKYESIKKSLKCVSEYEEMGYEGAIFRTSKNYYKCSKRNLEMRKLKNFIDAEYKIIGCKVDKGTSIDNFVWLLIDKKGNKFSAKPTGSVEQREGWYTKKEKYVGKLLTVKFQNYSEDGIPRFPTAKSIRGGVGID
jgi:ATP-dependent DNA ligase